MAESLVGRKVGRYQVVAELGRGQHTTVYKAWQPSLERHVALKVLLHYDQKTLAGFQNEARLTAQLVQQGVPNIRQVYEVGQTEEGHLFVAMEFVEDSLRNVLRRAQKQNYRLKPLSAVELLQPVAKCLDTLHRLGWVHLDIKPQNILIRKGGRAILADFGIAQRQGMQTHACTPVYASPEQAAGDRPVGPWSDIYSLGAVLYEMVTGHPPVRGDQDILLLTQHLEVTPPSPRRVNPLLTANQERAIYRALAKSPQKRFRTASELIEEMSIADTFLSGVIKTPTSLVDKRNRQSRAVRLVLIGIAVVVLLAVLFFLWQALWPEVPTSVPTPTETFPAPAATVVPSVPPASPTVVPTVATAQPTATLAPTLTRTPRPMATLTPEPVADPSETVGP